MRVLVYALHAVLLLGTLAVTFRYYCDAGYFCVIAGDVPKVLTYFVMLGVLGVSVAQAAIHVIGGGIFGMAAGGFWDGCRLGLMLGLGLSIGRLWPYVMTFAVGAFFAHAPNWHTIGAFLLGLIFLGIHMTVKFFWSRTVL